MSPRRRRPWWIPGDDYYWHQVRLTTRGWVVAWLITLLLGYLIPTLWWVAR